MGCLPALSDSKLVRQYISWHNHCSVFAVLHMLAVALILLHSSCYTEL